MLGKTGIPYKIVIPVSRAIDFAKEMALEDDVILIAGSVFLVGEAREILGSCSLA